MQTLWSGSKHTSPSAISCTASKGANPYFAAVQLHPEMHSYEVRLRKTNAASI